MSQPLLHIKEGELVMCGGLEYVITRTASLSQVFARSLDTGQIVQLSIRDLRPSLLSGADEPVPTYRDLTEVSERDWVIARARLEWITPLLSRRPRGEALAAEIAEKKGVSRATIYRWFQGYRNCGLLSCLLPSVSSGGRGKGRVTTEVELIITNMIEKHYKSDQKLSIKEVHEKVKNCFTGAEMKGLKPPHYQTVRRRVLWGDQRESYALRHGKRAASLEFDPIRGSIPDAHWPLAVVQIDHTLLPIMLVSEDSREPIGRPWVSFSIDVFSRMVTGMYLSLDPPSASSAGMCVAHSILPKDDWLRERNIDAEWPVWGVMGALHMDNAREFRGDMMALACMEYGVDVKLRPVKKPEYGAYIERLMGTVSQKLKALPGATFANPKEKGDYDADARSVMTLRELEEWLVVLIAKYHSSLHSGIGTTPIDRYREGLLGTKDKPGRGLPARRLDEEKVHIDFMPIVERTIQDYGVLSDGIYYFDDVLRPWVNAKDPKTNQSRLFPFRRDPHDISRLYFPEPNTKRYYPVRYRDLVRPPLTLWELRRAKELAKAAGEAAIDEATIFRYAARLNEIEAAATEKTRAARRQKERKKHHKVTRERTANKLPKTRSAETPPAAAPKIPGYDRSKVSMLNDD